MNNYEKWLGLKEQIRALTEVLHEVEADIWIMADKGGLLNPKGSKTYDVDGFKVTITHSDTYKVDQSLAQVRPELFRMKFEFDKTQYKNLVTTQKDFVDSVITITPAKPSFKVVRID